MNVTEVRMQLVQQPENGKRRPTQIKAFCSVTLDRLLVIHNVKVIEGPGGFFISFPSVPVTDKCPFCRRRNALTARFCCACGAQLDSNRGKSPCGQCHGDCYVGEGKDRRRCRRCGGSGLVTLYSDVAHPINTGLRDRFEDAILDAYWREVDHPGSVQPLWREQEREVV